MHPLWSALGRWKESSPHGQKRLHRLLIKFIQDYYGAESASLNLTQLYKKFREGAEPPPQFGKDRDYNGIYHLVCVTDSRLDSKVCNGFC